MKKLVFSTLIVLAVGMLFVFLVRANESKLSVLILYNENSKSYLDIYQHLSQSLIPNLEVDCQKVESLGQLKLDRYSVIYPDPAIIGNPQFENYKGRITDYVKSGGGIFLENEFSQSFPKELIGADELKKVDNITKTMDFPEVRYNLKGLQDIIRDFQSISLNFGDTQSNNSLPVGYGVVPSTAETIASFNGISLYTVNRYGKGSVLFTSLMLPNSQYINGFDLTAKNSGQQYFNFTTATANYMLRNEYLAFILKEKNGYVIKKVLGTYGRPAMAWQNHFEVSSAIKNGSIQKWTEFLKRYNQIPSFSLARSVYEWGLWKESIVYHLNNGTNESPVYVGEEDNSHYSSGRHFLVDNDYLTLQTYPESKSLAWPIELPYRAYPCIYDMNNDGISDLTVGSADGYVYYYEGKLDKDGLQFEKGLRMNCEDGYPVSVGSYAAQILSDLNKDGYPDIVVGNEDGFVYAFYNKGNFTFSKPVTLLGNRYGIKNAAPDIGDVDGDGIEDLVVGDADGKIYFCKGYITSNTLHFKEPTLLMQPDKQPLNAGSFAAPRLYDYDADGKKDIIAGTGEGFIKKFKNQYPDFVDDGYIEGETLNQFGTKYLWGGRNSVPFIADINNDGKNDLLVGQLEFGMPVPIDSPQFAYRQELKSALSYLKENHIPVEPHIYLHSYKSARQEQREIELHKKAFEYYNIPWNNTGTNQHTWRIDNLDATQTLNSEYDSGIWWNFGFRPSNNPYEPSLAYEYAWSIPFLLSNGTEQREMVLFNPAPNVTNYQGIYPSIARYDMPVSYFYHVEYAIQSSEGVKDLENKTQYLENFRNENDYNFMTEEQMFKSFLAVFKSKVSVSFNPVKKLFYSFENKLRTRQHLELYLNLDKASDSSITQEYSSAVGIKFEPGEKYLGSSFQTDSEIYLKKGRDLYLGLDKNTKIFIDPKNEAPHIMRVNMPVNIEHNGTTLDIDLLDSGLQQIKLYAPDGIELYNKDWELTGDKDYYILTRYGDKTKLSLKLK